MQKPVKIRSGKILELPSRMYLQKDLDEMDWANIPNQMYLLKTRLGEEFVEPSDEVKTNMIIVAYIDCTGELFEKKKLAEALDQLRKCDYADFLVVSTFENETEYETRLRMQMVSKLKEYTRDKDLVFELSYKSHFRDIELAKGAKNFDWLSVLFNHHFGGYPSLLQASDRVQLFRYGTSKRVICMGVPLMYSGDKKTDSHFLPCAGIIADAWSKCWRKGGGGNPEVRVIDPNDYKRKNYTGWLESGHLPHEIITSVDRTVHELFLNDTEGKNGRESFLRDLIDGAIVGAQTITPKTAENYIFDRRIAPKYQGLLIRMYTEKVIQELFRREAIFNVFTPEEKRKIEATIREQKTPSSVQREIESATSLLRKSRMSAEALMEQIQNMREVGSNEST